MERWKSHILVSVLYFCVVFPRGADFSPAENIKYNVVHSWADKLGMELFHLGDFITRRKEVQDSFKQAQVVERNGQKIVENMANEIKMMMDLKVSAVRRIMDIAENTALSHQNDILDVRFSYYNAKQMLEPGEPLPTEAPPDLEDVGVEKIVVPPKEIILNPKAEFFNTRVNLSHSSVHIPTNTICDVFLSATSKNVENRPVAMENIRKTLDRQSAIRSLNIEFQTVEVIQAIKWSENLDDTFKDNYKNDPTLSWQFYGSSTGFMRQFPASKWKQDPVDLYDCRLRSWYIEAATSPKDIVILMDGSGSMNGQRLDIAKHVVETILDTLGANDFVNIFTFGLEVKPVVSCFEDTLVQGTLDNIRELKEGMDAINKTFAIANFTAALVKAFEVLEMFRTESRGANCNQAIMLISDGAPFSYEEIFEQYNWQNKGYMPVRVFTYLIGKEVADVKEIKWMACENRGYYVHLSDLAEVREMVLNYIPVMARPLVLGRHDHPVIWTQVYADEVDPKMTDWLWEVKQCEEQKSDIENFRLSGYKMFLREEEERRYWTRRKKSWIQPLESDKYHFMTTVSMPVYDRRENALIYEDPFPEDFQKREEQNLTRIANLLGVAGTDVPIRDIRKLLSPFLLGVNGYAFIVTNNGYILFHPDFRPIFQDILKPAYNSVDMIEVELLDDSREPRNFNPMLIGIREEIINQSTGSKWMKVKNHFDEMKRVTRLKRYYFWTAVQNTPFTLVITYPEQYGVNRLQIRAEDEIHRLSIKGSNTANFFSGKKWKIHPDWLFCKHSNLNNSKIFTSPEAELIHFLDKMSKPGWKWPLSRSSLPPEHTAAMYSNTSSGRLPSLTEKESYYCDRNLMQSLVFDARVTEWFSKNNSFNSKDDNKGNEFKQRFGVTVAFLATHSGLTRWHEFHSNMAEEAHSGEQFGENNRRAIDEVWYKRAVDQHFVREESFVYSVPFDSGETNTEILVTASHAIFHTEGGKSAPAAVVGFQFQHRALYTLFKNITSNCVDCPKTCTSEEIDCYILDNNGYIVISPRRTETGKFFGDVNGALMRRLIEERVYQEVIIYDYQAVCFSKIDDINSSSKLFSPMMHILRLAKWLVHTLLWYIVQFHTVAADVMDHYTDDNMTDYTVNTKDWLHRVTLRRTRLKSCDHRRHLYTLYNETENVVYNMTAHACERPFVVLPIPASNLILLVLDVMCPKESAFRLTVDPLEIYYDYPENYTLSCYKRDRELLRIRPGSCINKHMNESEIKLCGDATTKLVNYILILFSAILIRYL